MACQMIIYEQNKGKTQPTPVTPHVIIYGHLWRRWVPLASRQCEVPDKVYFVSDWQAAPLWTLPPTAAEHDAHRQFALAECQWHTTSQTTA
jgi:hypothetical protein